MPLVRTVDLIARAVASGSAVPAFNVITLEHVEAVAQGAQRAAGPAILQVSENAVRYRRGSPAPILRAAAEVARESAVDLSLHVDHIQDDELLRQTVAAGASSAMYDAARLPYHANVEATRAAAAWAHERGLWLEGELGRVGGKDGVPPLDAHAPGARTDPDEAAAFVEATGVDALAVAVGSSHAMTTRTASLDHALIARLRAALRVPLVLHGSSGVPDDELVRAVGAGIVKVNVGTALNAAFTAAVRERLAADAALTDPRSYLPAGRDAMSDVVAHIVGLLGGGTPGARAARR